MRIAAVDTFVLKIDNDEPYLGVLPDGTGPADGYAVRPPWRSLYSPRFETVLVRLTAEDGTAGWGEALAPVGPEIVAAVVRTTLAGQLVGADARSPRPVVRAAAELMRERGHLVGHQADALAAVDIALWDLAGRLLEVPVATLLGGAYRQRIPTYVSGLPRAGDAERAELARDWVSRGASAVKLHLGHGVERDLATVDAVRAAAPTLRVAVDGHWAYRRHDARRLARGLAARDAWFLEAPLAPEDDRGHHALRDGPIPIAVGETLRNRFEFAHWLSIDALAIAQPDIGRTGITEAIGIAELCAARHVPVAPHHSVALGIALAAGLHVAAAVEDLLAFEYQPTSTEVDQRILRTPLQVGADHMQLPDGPGLGIEIDTEAVAAHTTSETTR